MLVNWKDTFVTLMEKIHPHTSSLHPPLLSLFHHPFISLSLSPQPTRDQVITPSEQHAKTPRLHTILQPQCIHQVSTFNLLSASWLSNSICSQGSDIQLLYTNTHTRKPVSHLPLCLLSSCIHCILVSHFTTYCVHVLSHCICFKEYLRCALCCWL